MLARSAAASAPAERACSTAPTSNASVSSGRPVFGESDPEVREEVESARRVLRQQPCRASEQIARRDQVHTRERAPPCLGEEHPGALRERIRRLVPDAQLLVQVEGALEMAGGRLIDVGVLGFLGQEPCREPLVKRCPELLRDAPIRRLGDQGMREPPPSGRLVVEVDESAAFQQHESVVERLLVDTLGERSHRGHAEPSAFDRRVLQYPSGRRLEVTDPGREERLHGRRDIDLIILRAEPSTLHEGSTIDQHRDQLLEEERIAFGRLADAVDDGPGGVGKQRFRQPPSVGGLEWRERRRYGARLPGCPCRSSIEELGTGETDHEERAVEPVHHRVDEVEHRFLCPMRVIKDHDERPIPRQRFEQAANGPRRIGGKRLMNAEDLGESIRNGGAVGLARQTSSEARGDRLGVGRLYAGGIGEELDQRRERDAFSVGRRLGGQNAGAPVDRVRERLGEPRLADPGRSEDRDEDAGLGFDRVLQGMLERGDRARAAEERGLRQ